MFTKPFRRRRGDAARCFGRGEASVTYSHLRQISTCRCRSKRLCATSRLANCMDGKSVLQRSEDQENRSAAEGSTRVVGMSRQSLASAGRAWRPIRNVLSRRESSMTSTGERVAGRKVPQEGVKLRRRVFPRPWYACSTL